MGTWDKRGNARSICFSLPAVQWSILADFACDLSKWLRRWLIIDFAIYGHG
jgi:hypothetical protein